jgi:hypothetical protein
MYPTTNPLGIKTLMVVAFLVLVSRHPAAAQTAQAPPTGEAVDGVQMAISLGGMLKPGVPTLQVVFRNLSDKDVNLNLGTTGGYSPRPCKLDKKTIPCTLDFKLNIVDSHGVTRTYTFSGIFYVAGRLDAYIISLHAKSTYTLELGIDQFWSPETHEYEALALAKGRYQLSLEFEGRAPRMINLDQPNMSTMTFWTGKITSNSLSVDIARQSSPNK